MSAKEPILKVNKQLEMHMIPSKMRNNARELKLITFALWHILASYRLPCNILLI